MSNDIQDSEILKVKEGLLVLGEAIETIASRELPMPEINDRSLSGNKIHGGRITQFQSVGIKDDSTRLVVLVNDNGLLTDYIDVDTIVGNTKVSGNLDVDGEITARKLHVDEISADVRQERTSPLEFVANEEDSIYGKGLLWTGEGYTRQLIMQGNPDRIFSSETIDVHRDKHFSVGGIEVLNQTTLGSTVRESSLTSVGTLHDLKTQGDMVFDEFIYWNSDQMRMGFGTDQPNGLLSIVADSAEFIVEPEGDSVKIGTWTTSDLEFVTDDTVRLTIGSSGAIVFGVKGADNAKVNINGKLGVGVNNVDDVSIATAGPVRFQGKKQEVGNSAPTTGVYKVGDIVWNDNPRPTSYIGWVCIREGTPGEWKPFGQIGS